MQRKIEARPLRCPGRSPNITRMGLLDRAFLNTAAAALALVGSTAVSDAVQTLLDFSPGTRIDDIETRGAAPALSTDAGGRTWLRLATGIDRRWPGITLHAPEGGWDFDGHVRVEMDVRNLGDDPVTVYLRIDSTTTDASEQTAQITVEPRAEGTLSTPIRRRLPVSLADRLFGMRGFPGGYREQGLVEPSQVTRLLVFVGDPKRKHLFEVDRIRLRGTLATGALPGQPGAGFFPMIDRYGQYMHGEWPGKIQTDEDLQERRRAELADLESNPGGQGRSRWGGWSDGPTLEATGRFRVEKLDGRWWLVDPDGALFWSHGVDCVQTVDAVTPIDDREHLFAALPEEGSPFAAFYGSSTWAPHGYYAGRGRYRTYSFGGANLFRKYGERFRDMHADIAHRRIRSWGMNTIANWSDSGIYLRGRNPYTGTIHLDSKPIEASEGFWRRFPDPFDPSFRQAAQRAAARVARETAEDPWCIGYFVDNELGWGTNTSLARAILASPSGQAAKDEVTRWLRARHGTIERLNESWRTAYASWDALRGSTKVPEDTPGLVADLEAFYSILAETYFRIIHDALEAAAPGALYLGCRFSNDNPSAVRAAGKYCDVISFNRYAYSVADLALPTGTDRPVLIGEFHFGALDRGMFHTGLRSTVNQAERGRAYVDYVTGALTNPYIVGTHWFQYRDQATTGRGDGENYQIGFVDSCDTPYPETVAASRRVGRSMYRIRTGGTAGSSGDGLPARESSGSP